jgi:c(7)-type cytochrome triheme protein
MPQILLYVFIILFSFLNLSSSQGKSSAKNYEKNIPSAKDYGTVILNNYSKQADVIPVVFDHWLHRAKFTCRICHVDIGFAMKAQATNISAIDNINGYYCGSCHDGKRIIEGKKIFAACAVKYTEEEGKRCVRCHSVGKEEQREYDFKTFTENLPGLYRNLIDWEKAEAEGKIKPVDFLEGISFKRDPLKAQEDFSIKVTAGWKSDVIFSHKKHIVWNGCEVCHPLIFPSSKKGTVNYSMFEIMDGEYCGVCHVPVAFSVWLCYKCHKDPV